MEKMLLDTVLFPSKSTSPLLIVEHDLSRSPVPLLRAILGDALNGDGVSKKSRYSLVILATFLHPPESWIRGYKSGSSGDLRVFDYTDVEFTNGVKKRDAGGLRKEWMDAIDKVPSKDSILLLVDDLDYMALELGSRQALGLVQDVVDAMATHRAPSRFLTSVASTGISHQPPVIEHVLSTTFSPSLTHLRIYLPQLFTHLSKTFLLPPPPQTPEAKFYNVFGPFVARQRNEAEKLWYANPDEGSGGESVIEIVIRSVGLRKSVERGLEGWTEEKGMCRLEELPTLRECFAGYHPSLTVTDPSAQLSFNLNLTDEQSRARASVPLPYAHTGEKREPEVTANSAAIYYDPDSADDLDEEDPDEDLDL